jgi:hypothetical protein
LNGGERLWQAVLMGPRESAQVFRPGGSAQDRPWWESRWTVAALILLSAVPLLWPAIPPLVDLPGHIGRYRVELDLDRSPGLARFYTFQWQLIGNLGIDLLVVPLSKVMPLELAVKLIVLSIPPLTVAGFLWVAREVHGRIPPTALFAVPLAYNYPFLFGFANFALSMAFAFLAFGLWLRLARMGRLKLRAAVFVPLSMALWVTHTFGWGALGVMAYSAELVRQHDKGRGYLKSALRSAFHCLSLAPPILLMLAWRSGHVKGQTGDWFNWQAKYHWLVMAIRDRWIWFDVLSLAVIVLLIVRALRSKRIGFSRNLAASALFLALVFLLLPRIVFGSAYADMRLVPYAFATALIAIRLREGVDWGFARRVALVGLAFAVVRTAGSSASFFLYARSWDGELAALDYLPPGARLLSFVGKSCTEQWWLPHFEHLPAVALERKQAFSNDQWTMAGAQLLRVKYREGGRFTRDPSQIVTDGKCPHEVWFPVNRSLRDFPRAAFDFVWLIDPPPFDGRLTADLRPVWTNGRSILFAVPHQPEARPGSPPAISPPGAAPAPPGGAPR